MSGNSNLKAINLLNRIQVKTGISESEKNALIQVYNPFCDFDHEIVGWPSLQDTKSNVTKNDYTMTISAPEGTTNTWDCHVVMSKQTNVTNLLAFSSLASGILFENSEVTTEGNFGGVSAMSQPTSGSPLNFAASAFAGNSIQSIGPHASTNGLNIATDDIQKVHRVIAKAFEVRLDANALSDQGTVVTYSQPETGLLDRVAAPICFTTVPVAPPLNPAEQGVCDLVLGDDVPGTPADCLLLTGSKQWYAREGVMMVGKLANWEIKPQTLISRKLFLRGSKQTITLAFSDTDSSTVEGDVGVSTLNPNLYAVSTGTVAGVDCLSERQFIDQVSIDDFNLSGALFTGLSPSATLVVNFVVYIESFPDSTSATLVKLARATENYSPIFPQMVSQMMRHMPAAAVIADNKSGDWFFEGMQWLTDAIQPALAMGGPVGMALSAAAGAVNTWSGSKLKERQQARVDSATLAGLVAAQPQARIGGNWPIDNRPVVVSTAPTIQQIRAADRKKRAAPKPVVNPPGQGQSRRAVRKRALAAPTAKRRTNPPPKGNPRKRDPYAPGTLDFFRKPSGR